MIFSHVLYQLSYLGISPAPALGLARRALYRGWARVCPAHLRPGSHGEPRAGPTRSAGLYAISADRPAASGGMAICRSRP